MKWKSKGSSKFTTFSMKYCNLIKDLIFAIREKTRIDMNPKVEAVNKINYYK